jgi:hypothetical protein
MNEIIFNENAKWGRNRDQRKELVKYILTTFGDVISRKQLLSLIQLGKCSYNDLTWIFVNKEFKGQRGQYNLSSMVIRDEKMSAKSVDAVATM